MALCPDFSDDDSDFSDDGDYYSFKEKIKQLKTTFQNKTSRLSEAELTDQRKKNLYFALCSGNKNAVIEYLQDELDVNTNIQDNWTAILLAASFGNPELTEELIKLGADVNSARSGCSSLMMACNCPEQTSSYEKSFAVIKLLVEKGANVKAINRKRMTALMFAANNGHLEAVKYLLPLSDKNAEDNQKWTALFWAVNGNAVYVAEFLLEHKLEYKTTDIRNNTPLDLARNNNLTEIIELFPKDETDLYNFMDSCPNILEEIYSLRPGEKPKLSQDIYNFLCGIKSEFVFKILVDNNVNLADFLSSQCDELRALGVKLPYQRERILGNIYKFHKYPFHPKSLHVVSLKECYSNVDVTIQLASTIKQLTAIEASLRYLRKHCRREDFSEPDRLVISKNIQNLNRKVELCKKATRTIKTKTVKWDECVKPVDLITSNSRSYRAPWRKIVFSVTLFSLFVIIRFQR